MAKITWDKTGERFFETGIKNVVLYPEFIAEEGSTAAHYGGGVAWNGVTGVTESPSGAEATDLYADDIKYLSLLSVEQLGATLTAYQYPEEFAVLDGSAELVAGVTIGQQARKMFGLSYITTVGNDVDGNDHGEKLHLMYGIKASPSERAYATINDSPEAIEFSWELNTTPVEVGNIGGTTYKPTALITIDSRKADKTKYAALKEILYGSESAEPIMPMPAEVYAALKSA